MGDFDDIYPNRVKVILYGRILDRNYTQLLHAKGDLDLSTVFLLDKVQKKEVISKESYFFLKKQNLVEGRYPHIYVSYEIADAVGQKTDYIRNRGLTIDVYKQIIENALETMGRASVGELKPLLASVLPAILDDKQQSRKISNILQSMRRDGVIDVEGTGHTAKWYIKRR